MFEDQVTALNFPSPPKTGADLPEHAERIVRLCDERLRIGHFVIHLPDEVRWSPQMFEITGVPFRTGALKLEDMIEPFDGTDRIRLAEVVTTALKDRKGFQATLRLRRPDGSLRLVECVGDVTHDAGHLEAIVGVLREVEWRQAGPRGSVADLDQLKATVQAMPVPALLTDTEMHILAFSDLWAKSHGITSRDVVGKDVLEVVHRAPAGWALEHAKVVAGHPSTTERMFHDPATNRPMKCMTSLTPWRQADGAVAAVITIIGWSEFGFASKEIATFVKNRPLRG
jgi:PAS domain-containing protein